LNGAAAEQQCTNESSPVRKHVRPLFTSPAEYDLAAETTAQSVRGGHLFGFIDDQHVNHRLTGYKP
jgi:hypothetical protein